MPSKVWSSVSGITCTPSSHSRERAGADRVVEVAAVEVGVDAAELLRLLPHQAVDAERPASSGTSRATSRPSALTRRNVWTPKPSIVRYERGIARSDITHISMCGDSGMQRHEVPERVVRGLRLRDLAIGLGLGRVDQVGELDAVLDEEDRDVVADEIEDALVGVELRREAADVADGVGRAARADDGREAGEHRRRRARPGGSRRT